MVSKDLEDVIYDNDLSVESDGGNENDKWHDIPKLCKVPELDFKNDLALDTGVTFTSVRNKKLVTDITKVEHPILMYRNTGEQKIDKT